MAFRTALLMPCIQPAPKGVVALDISCLETSRLTPDKGPDCCTDGTAQCSIVRLHVPETQLTPYARQQEPARRRQGRRTVLVSLLVRRLRRR